MAPETRAAFHRTAARLLYGDGLPAAAVAALLRLAGPVGEPWEIAVLTDAAEAALRDDRARLALDYLQMAQDACLDEHRRLEIVIRRALISRRVNLHIAERQLAEPLRALRTGRLPVSQFGPLAKLLGAQGRVEEANEVIACLDELIDDGAGVEADSQVVSLWAATPYPPMVSVSPVGYRRRGLEAVPAKPAASTQREGELTAADELLAAIALTDTSLDLVVNSIKSLLCGGRVDRAELWCARFLAEADERQAPGWLASFSWVAAEIALRQGQLAVAEDRASTAIELVSEHSGGIFVAAPTATSVQAYLAMGEVEAAGRRLNLPVTDLLFKTKAGLNFRRARALYYAATNRPHVALEEFLAIGQVAKRWNFDQPLILPWRSDAAEALLRLGEAEQAGQLATEQLARSENADHWPRGVALRVRAMAAPASQRVSWLSQSEDELRVSGDRLELARTLADQAETYQSLGEFARAAAVKRRAWRLADECGAAPLRARLGVEAGRRGDKAVPGRRGGNDESALSDSERRVATLAACGETNRAIARKLYITLSTVEQHLTRVYRKLGISGRQELPSDLQFEADRIA
jgi:DNA-binding CsgD family transcriptional regulator